MSQSYQSKDSGVQSVQLKVQELCLNLSDTAVISSSGSTVTIDFKEPVKEFRSVVFQKASDGSLSGAPFVGASTTGNATTFTLAAPMAAGDSITIKYVINESI
jgi:hypothetical protein